MDLRMGHLPRHVVLGLMATVLASGDPSGIDKLPAPAVPGVGICAAVLIRRTRALKNDSLGTLGSGRWRFGDKPQTSADWASSILLCAVKFNNLEIAEAALEAGANPSVHASFIAVSMCVCRTCVSAPHNSACGLSSGMRFSRRAAIPLFVAQEPRMLECILRASADPNAIDADCWTPLHHICAALARSSGRDDNKLTVAVDVLLRHGAVPLVNFPLLPSKLLVDQQGRNLQRPSCVQVRAQLTATA